MNKTFKLSLVFLVLIILSSFAFADFTTDNQLWASLQDGNVSNFDLYGGVTGVTGVVDGAFYFDGVDDDMATTITTQVVKSINISVKSDLTSISSIQRVISAGSTNGKTSSMEWRGDVSGDPIDIYCADGTNYISERYANVFTDTNWHNYTIECLNSDIKFYKNGIEQTEIAGGSGSGTGELYFGADATAPIAFGSREKDSDRYFAGSIDEIYMYSDIAQTTTVFYANMDSLYDYSSRGESEYTVSGATKTTGILDNAYDFDGSTNYLESTTAFDSTDSDFTMSCWVDSDETSRGDYFGQSGFGKLLLGLTTSKYGAVVDFSGGSGAIVLVSTTNVDTSNFVHTVLTYNKDTKTAKLYIDGTEEDSDTSTGTKQLNSEVVSVGLERSAGSSYNALNGALDECKIFNKTLTTTEIEELWNEGTPIYNEVAKENELFYMNAEANPLQAYNGVTYDATENAYDFDGDNDYVDMSSIANIRTVSLWVDSDATPTGSEYIYSHGTDSDYAGGYFGITQTSASNYAMTYQFYAGGSWQRKDTGIYNGNHHLVIAIDDVADKTYFYIDGSLEETINDIPDGFGATLNSKLSNNNNNYYFDGKISGITIYDYAFSSTNVSDLYAEGRDYNPYTVTPTPVVDNNESTEQLQVVKQVSPVTINSPTLTTVLAGSFEIENNDTDVYGGYNFNVLSNVNNQIYCELQIEGTPVANVSRSNTGGELGSISLMTEGFTSPAGNFTQEMKCRKIGGGSLTVSNAVGVGHVLVNGDGEAIPHNSTSFTDTVTSGATYTLMDTMSYTVSNKTTPDTENHLILEWSATYTNNHNQEELLYTYIDINGTACSVYPRTVDDGDTASVGGDCLLSGVTNNATYDIKFYGNGTDATYNVNLIAKEFVLNDSEISGGQGALVGTTFSGNTDTSLINVTGGNLNHGSASVFEKQSYSILTDEDTNVNMYIVMTNGDTYRTINMTRDYEADKVGVLTSHDVFEDVAQDNYTLEVFANCGSPTATCEIVGGAGIGYLTDTLPTEELGFNITAYDIWNDNTLYNLSAIDGVTFSTTTGTLFYVTTEELVNFTLTASDGSGYISKTFTNYNTSNDLNQSMYQTITIVNATTLYGNSGISDFTLVTGEGSFATTNGSVTIYPNYGAYYWNLTDANFNNVANYGVTIFEETGQIIIENVTDATATFIDKNTALPFNNSGVLITYPDSNTQQLYTDINGDIVFGGYRVGDYSTYSLTFQGTLGYVTPITFDVNTSIASLPSDTTYEISQTNINITLKDADDSSSITDNVTVSISGLGTYYTTNGSVILVNTSISAGTYTIYVDSDNYEYNQKTFTYTSQENLDIDIYMYNSSLENLGYYVVTAYDSFLDVSAEADLRLQELDPSTGSFKEVSQRITSAQGVATFQVLLNEKIYRVYGSYTEGGVTYEGYTTELGRVITFTGDSENIYFDTISSINYDEYDDLSITVSNTELVGNISYHTVDFVDSAGLSHNICLRYSYKSGVLTIPSLEICSEGSSGSISSWGGYYLDRNYTWIVDAYVKEGDYKRYVYSETYENDNSFSDIFRLIMKFLIGATFLWALAWALYQERIDIFIYSSIALSVLWLGLAPSYISARFLGLMIVLGLLILDMAKNRTSSEEN